MNRDAKIVLLVMAILVMVGVVMIYSSSAVYSEGRYSDSMFFVKRHLLYLLFGLAAMAFCMTLHMKALEDNSRYILLFFIVLLIAVLIPGIGKQIGGARRWVRLLGFGFQPSETAKVALIIYLSALTARKQYLMSDLRHGFLPPLAVTGLVSLLVILEPDMGTAVSILFIGVTMLFAAGARIKHLAVITSSMLPVMAAAVIFEPYRVRRMVAFFDPWKDALGSGFQLIQSFIALGSGGIWGVGLGASKQKLFYLPESHTDFIFSIIGEETGFIGTASVLILFAVFVWFSLRIAFKLKDVFLSRLVFGISIMIAFEVIVNIGVSSGIFPTKGLPLPFISYGGSSLVCHLAAVGLVLNAARGVE